MTDIMAKKELDALIVGAGFGGIYQLYRLRQLGLSARVVDTAADVGGTWFWNRYPGAMSDTESHVYRFFFDREDLLTYPWTHHYVQGPDALKYLQHIVEKHDLRIDMQFSTTLVGADWDDKVRKWHVQLSSGEQFSVRYLITALGVLSTINFPDIPGIDSFQGQRVHTAAWPDDLDISNKRVGIIGCGSTGVQVITAIAPKVKSLVCFQRHPQYSVPSGDRPVEPEYRKWVNENYNSIIAQVKESSTAFGIEESTRPFTSVSDPRKREAIFEDLWRRGNGFRFMFGGFSDITTNPTANEGACDFIRRKIATIVKDPEKARKLQPKDAYARRPLCDGGYYQQFNRSNVDIVHLQETPITTITPTGVQTTTEHYQVDVLIFATGFDAIEGSYNRIRIRGRDGLSLTDYWDPTGPRAYLGITVPHFPNLFMVLGPQLPFTNIPPTLEAHVEIITHIIQRAERARVASGGQFAIVEATQEAGDAWTKECEREAEGSLFKSTASWIFGQNIKGKPYALRFYFGGLKKYYAYVQEMMENEYRGFQPLNAMETRGIVGDVQPRKSSSVAVKV